MKYTQIVNGLKRGEGITFWAQKHPRDGGWAAGGGSSAARDGFGVLPGTPHRH
ncbi:MAG TPA: hypothetical protein VGP13_03795 [Candidatus Paceibacterota bacterium]|nr:hypothetical protein [Candidatus Paceibacterota bacterium]